MTLATERGEVWARGGVIGPPQRAGNLFARSAGMPKLHPVEGGWDRRGARSCTPDRLGYVLIPACDRPQRSTRAERRLLNELTLMRHAATA